MKKKLLVILLSVLAMTTAVFGLTACDDSSGSCEHNFTVVREAKKSTCSEAGTRQVQKCNSCGIYYIPATFKEFDSEEDAFEAAALGGGAHDTEYIKKTEPSSCDVPGYSDHYKCKACNKVFSDPQGSKEINLNSIKIEGEHNLVYNPAVGAGCYTAGNYVYYKCDDCERLFSDANGTQETTLENVTISAVGHDFEHGHHERVEPTCEYGGSIEYYTCSRCQKRYTEETAENEITNYDDIWLDNLGHDLSVISTLVEADCELDEVIRRSCSRTGCEVYEDVTTENSAIGHSFVNGECTNCKCDEFSLGLEFSLGYRWEGEEQIFEYTLSGLGTWTIEDNLIIPNTYKGLPVVAVNLSDSTESLDVTKKIILPENVKSVQFGNNNTNTTVTEVVINSQTMAFEYKAFSGFEALETLTTPTNFTVTQIGESAFSGCALKEVELSGTYTEIGGYAFCNNQQLKSVKLNGKATSIGYRAFMDCDLLEKVEIYDPIEVIGDNVFNRCAQLKEIYIPSTVTKINYNAFGECSSLEKVIIDDVKSFAKIQFADTANPLSYAHYLYKKTDTGSEYLGNITLDSTVYDSEYLANSTKINEDAFKGCYNLVKVSLPSGITEIGESAFEDCINLVEVELHPYGSNSNKTLTTIKYEAFKNCESLKKITYPSSITNVESEAFEGCEAVESIYYSTNNITPWINTDFASLTSNPMYAGNSTVYLLYFGQYGTTAELGIDLTPNEVNGVKQPYALKKNVLAGFNGRIEGIEYLSSIGEYAFYNAKGVKGYLELDGIYGMSDAYFPQDFYGTTKIGEHAFDGCVNLGEVRLSKDLVSVGNYAFANSGITSLYMMGENTAVGEYILKNCNGVESLYLAFFGRNSQDTNCKLSYYFGEGGIPTTLEELNVASGNYWSKSLEGATNLKSLWLPKSFFMASDALGNIYYTTPLSELTIYYAGSLEDWIDNGGLCDDTLSSSITLYVWDSENYQYDLVDDLVIPETVTYLKGGYTFANVTSLRSVTLHSNLSFSSGNSCAFYGCVNLLEIYNYTSTELTMGATSYGYVAKYAVAIYTQEDEEPRIVTTEDGFIFGISKVEEGETPEITLHGYCGIGGDIVLPSSVTIGGVEYTEYKIADDAFRNNETITSLVVPSNVKKIGASAFLGCTSLKTVTLSEGLESIGDYAFSYTALSTFTIPNSVTEVIIPLSECQNLYQITIGENCPRLSLSFYLLDRFFEIVDYSSTNSNLESSSYVKSYGNTSNIQKQGDFVFGTVDGVTYLIAYEGSESVITLPTIDGTYVIEDNFLKNDQTVTKVIVPDCVTAIGSSAFYGSVLSEVVIGEGVKTIGYGAFSEIDSLQEVVLPNGLESISYNAFNATVVEKLVFSDNSYPQIEEAVFSEIKEIYINSLSHLLALDCKSTLFVNGAKLYVDGSLVTELVISGNDASVIKTKTFMWLKTVDKVIIDGVTVIEDNAFCNLKTSEIVIKNVQVIEEGAFSYTTAKKITIENVAYVGENAFSYSEVEELALSGVEYLGVRAFAECYYLEKVAFGSGLKVIESGAFYNVSLDEVVLPETIEYVGSNAFYSAKKNLYKNSHYLGTKTNPYKVLVIAGYESMDGIVIHEDCTIIGGGAFYQYTDVPVTLHEGIVSIGDEAFINSEITSITLPSTLKYIGERAFDNSYLTSITIPANVEYIGASAFESCDSLSFVIFEEGCSITEINESTFYNCPITSIELPDTVQYVYRYAFGNLEELTIGSNLVYVEECGFGYVQKLNVPTVEAYLNIEFESEYAQFLYNYSEYGKIYVNGIELTQIVVPKTVTEIHAYAFYENPYITSFVGNDNLERIGKYAFSGAELLEEVDLKGVKVVEERVFDDAYALTTVSMVGIEEIGEYAFNIYDYNISGSRLSSITIGANLKSVGEEAFTYGEPEVNFLGTVDQWASIDFHSEESNPARYKGLKINGSKLSDITLTVSEVKPYTFYNNLDITSLTFADTVEKIGAYAFYIRNDNSDELEPQLSSIIIGNGVTEIGKNAFYFNYNVETLSIGNSVKVIGEEAFAFNSSLATVELSDSVEELGRRAFGGCKFQTLHIGKSLKTIGENALCSGITKITVDSENEYFAISNKDLYTKDLSTLIYNV